MKAHQMWAPLRVCFAFESMAYTPVCSANFTVPYSDPPVKLESISNCPGRDYCGYDPDLWGAIADRSGLQEGRDWVRVCAGSSAYSYVLEDMAEYESIHIKRNDSDSSTAIGERGEFRPAGACDVFASGMAATEERGGLLGLQFTRPILRSPMAALVHAPIDKRGMWEFLRPLTPELWTTMLATVLLVPVAVVSMELILSDSRYRFERWRWRGRMSTLHALGQGIWESAGHFIHTHHFPARTLPGRVIVAMYAFMTLVFANTYMANLAAWTTADRIQSMENSFSDLSGKPVVSFTAFQQAIEDTLGISTMGMDTPTGTFWADAVAKQLSSGAIAAVVFYEQSLHYVISSHTTDSLRMLDERVRILDTVFAFRRTYSNTTVIQAVNNAMLQLQESGAMSTLQEKYIPIEANTGEESPTELIPVPLFPLSGLWVINAMAVLVAVALACARIYAARLRPNNRSSRGLMVRSQMLRKGMHQLASSFVPCAPTHLQQLVQDTHSVVSAQVSDCLLMLQDTRRTLESMRGALVGDELET